MEFYVKMENQLNLLSQDYVGTSEILKYISRSENRVLRKYFLAMWNMIHDTTTKRFEDNDHDPIHIYLNVFKLLQGIKDKRLIISIIVYIFGEQEHTKQRILKI